MTERPQNKNLRPFKKGHVSNPHGRPKTPRDLLEARKLNTVELERTINKYLFSTREELREALNSKKTPMLEVMVISIMIKAAQNGDQGRLEFVLQRMLGKVKDKLEITEDIKSQHLAVNVNMNQGQIPSVGELSLDNPNLTMAQLESFQEKIGQIQMNLAEKQRQLPLQAEVVEGEVSPPPEAPG